MKLLHLLAKIGELLNSVNRRGWNVIYYCKRGNDGEVCGLALAAIAKLAGVLFNIRDFSY